MEFILNNNPEKIEKDSITISELMIYKKFTFRMLVVKINDQLIKKDAYDSARVHAGDRVIVLHLVSGG